MTQTWAELLGDEAPAAAPQDEEERRGWFRRLRSSLSASGQALARELSSVFDPRDDEAWERIEEALQIGRASCRERV